MYQGERKNRNLISLPNANVITLAHPKEIYLPMQDVLALENEGKEIARLILDRVA